MDTYKFSDEVISHIAKSVQLAILSGTDIVDHMRQIQLTPGDDNSLELTDEFRSSANDNIEKMLERADALQGE
tara:strand:- start:2566 stop:2784 length:219 start_codon:yes stop_codon:yes gene_type:complete